MKDVSFDDFKTISICKELDIFKKNRNLDYQQKEIFLKKIKESKIETEDDNSSDNEEDNNSKRFFSNEKLKNQKSFEDKSQSSNNFETEISTQFVESANKENKNDEINNEHFDSDFNIPDEGYENNYIRKFSTNYDEIKLKNEL